MRMLPMLPMRQRLRHHVLVHLLRAHPGRVPSANHPSKPAPRHRLTRRSAQESRELTMRGATKVQAVAAAPPVAAYPTAQPVAQPAPVSTMGKGP